MARPTHKTWFTRPLRLVERRAVDCSTPFNTPFFLQVLERHFPDSLFPRHPLTTPTTVRAEDLDPSVSSSGRVDDDGDGP